MSESAPSDSAQPGQTAQAGGAASAKPAASQPKPQPKHPVGPPPSRGNDPVIRWLTIAIFAVIVLALVSFLSALLFGLVSPAKAPRTEAERDLLVLGTTVQSGKANTQTYAQYISVLISSGQLSKADQAITEALKTARTDKSYIYAQQAQLALTRNDYQGAVTLADQTMKTAQAELKAFEDANVAANRRRDAGAVLPTSFSDAALIKAQAYVASKNVPEAIKAFNVYLQQSPTDSDVLVQRGLLKAQSGDKSGAEADFRAALQYIPDYQPALDGLKQIGASR